jgi:riboflavin kinase/FMN adenylyltransferase
LPIIIQKEYNILKVYYDISQVKLSNPVATIGIFDGVHLAHLAIIDKLKKTAQDINGESVIVTLWPHPRIVLHKEGEPLRLINTLEEKIIKLENAGVDNLIILAFDKKFATMGFEEFVKNILFDKFCIRHLVVGFNHHFGKNREGNYSKLQELSQKLGFTLEQLNPFIVNDEKVSSSAIRKFILTGKIEKTNELLGYSFFVTGKVVVGKKLGKDLGFPTANITISEPNKIIPQNGVYAVMIEAEGNTYMGMMNIGYRPTIDHNSINRVLEVHIIDFVGDLYNKLISVSFIKRIRDEQKFDSVEELVNQIIKDKENITNILTSFKKH